eukprot:TRINITY_DN6270_c0_g1_i3.p1 TRINITY_DN6270_c0_g1~~TRINITY_DN6270_c0_g1_i3.p1  ORF type:complete len:300 (+),score=78.41 TRINITY_DN6270_c0_g1_i3:37-936(+)
MAELAPSGTTSSDAEEEDNLGLLDDLANLWDEWAGRWEAEFERLSRMEDERLARVAEQVNALALRGSEAYSRSVVSALQDGDAAARRISAWSAAMDEKCHKQAVTRLGDDAELSRIQATKSALQGSDDLYREILEDRAARKEARDAKRKEAKKARQAEMEARWKQREKEQRNEDARKSAPTEDPQQPRFTRTPGAAAAKEAQGAALPQQKKQPGWEDFEQKISQAAHLCLAEVPWPNELPATVSEVSSADSLDERKRKLRKAVLRWHPDKWGPAIPLFSEAERAEVLERVRSEQRCLNA